MEAIITLAQLQNINIYAQGYYFVRVTLKNAAITQTTQCEGTLPNNLQLKPPSHSGSQYCSKVFFIRYREETILLNEVFQFRTSGLEASMTIELMTRITEVNEKVTPVTDTSLFQVASTKEVRFPQTFEHLVVHFDNAFVSLLQLNILSIGTADATARASILSMQKIIKQLSPAVDLQKQNKVVDSQLHQVAKKGLLQCRRAALKKTLHDATLD